ncbi:Putative Tox-ART-HYD1 domain-containing protein [Septoria linicola]|uniref:Tox-ART-HYD1 domain-containing protein n=1 Tax=Septoria linicola TaxID=215465 RepID=A0A9Q9EGC1_9PEZI|nr:Putative Tox-ART-HYD1 domain-containing protein [Septoria linicola]
MAAVEFTSPPKRAPRSLCHYTNEAGYNAILQSQTLKASVVEGKKSTHYGRGVYFTTLMPVELSLWGHYEGIRRIFADVTQHSVERTCYYFELDISEQWRVVGARFDGLDRCEDIWIVRGESDLDIRGHIRKHGKTDIGHKCDELVSHVARDYAYRLNTEHAESKRAIPEPVDTRTWGERDDHAAREYSRKRPMVFIGGQAMSRPEGWYEDYNSQH